MNNSKRWRSLNDFGAQNYEYNNNGFQYSNKNNNNNRQTTKIIDQRNTSAYAYGSSYYCDRKYSSNYALTRSTSNNISNQYQSKSRHQQQQKSHLRASVDNLLEAQNDRTTHSYKYVDQVSGKLQCSTRKNKKIREKKDLN
jgi:hypothetical protein